MKFNKAVPKEIRHNLTEAVGEDETKDETKVEVSADVKAETKYALEVTIKAGVIDTAVLDDANPDEFLAGVDVIETSPVVGWKFSEIHLVEGNQKNGKGYAFF